MRTAIREVRARAVFDSRGMEAIEVEVRTEGGGRGRFAAPSGTSRGVHEVVDYPPAGVREAVRKVEEIAPKLIGVDSSEQAQVDNLLAEIDGSANFSNIGGNTACALSIAVAEAAADTLGVPLYRHLAGKEVSTLPYPLGNVISGGRHADGRAPDVQEFLVLPMGARSISEALQANVLATREAHNRLRLRDPSFGGGRSLEGAWIAGINTEQALELLTQICDDVRDKTGVKMKLGVDFAASSIWSPKRGRYAYRREGRSLTREGQMSFVAELTERFPMLYLEDPLHEDDFEGFATLTRELQGKIVCGDDLFVTNLQRLKRGIEIGACNAVIIKPNQVGTITRAREAAELARAHGYVPIASHRSGENVEFHLVHITVAFQCPVIKAGILGGERIAKLNELLRLEEIGLRLSPLSIG